MLLRAVQPRYMGRGVKSRRGCTTTATTTQVTACLATRQLKLSLSRRNVSPRWTSTSKLGQATILQTQTHTVQKLPQIWRFLYFKGRPSLPAVRSTPLVIHLLIQLQIRQRMTAQVHRAAVEAATNPSASTIARTCSASAPPPPQLLSALRLSSCPSSALGRSSSASKEDTDLTRAQTLESPLSPRCRATTSSVRLCRTPPGRKQNKCA